MALEWHEAEDYNEIARLLDCNPGAGKKREGEDGLDKRGSWAGVEWVVGLVRLRTA